MIGGLCVVLLIIWKYVPSVMSKFIPGPLLAVGVGLGLSYYLNIEHPHSVNWLERLFHIGPEFLVHVPNSMKDLFITPNFDMVFTFKGLMSVMTIFIVGTLESLLSAYAVDKLDPYNRVSDLAFEIIGKGIANIFCGLLGAYPIITEIVRSSATISNGARTKWSNFYHGLFLIIFVALLPDLINHIPVSALAAILLLVGFNLAHPRHFVAVWNHGKDQFFVFTLTLVVTLVEDLLIGIVVGVIAQLILHFIKGVKLSELFSPKILLEIENDKYTLNLNSNVVFLGYLRMKKTIVGIDKTQAVTLKTNGYFIDFTIKELLNDSFVIKE
jgi:MFS superfamily sulfate permease-like transporter